MKESIIKTVPPGETEDISLYPGELYIHTGGPGPRVWTLLGSCVAVALFNRKAGIGAICHAQLPQRRLKDLDCSRECPEDCEKLSEDTGKFRYMTCAIKQMLKVLVNRGMPASSLSAYLIGGSEVAPGGTDFFRVGAGNIEMAKTLLRQQRISIVFEDTGGKVGRSLYFFPATGRLYYRFHGEKEFRSLLE